MGFQPQNVPRLAFPEPVRAVVARVGSLHRNGQILGFGQNPCREIPNPDFLSLILTSENTKVPENTGICISGIRPLCGGVNFPKWTSFLVLVKTRQCKVKGGQVFACRTGRKQAAPQAHVTNFFYPCHFLLIARADCSPPWGSDWSVQFSALWGCCSSQQHSAAGARYATFFLF